MVFICICAYRSLFETLVCVLDNAVGNCTVEEFDTAKYLNTDPTLVQRVFNRPRLETLSTASVQGNLNETSLAVRYLNVITFFNLV